VLSKHKTLNPEKVEGFTLVEPERETSNNFWKDLFSIHLISLDF